MRAYSLFVAHQMIWLWLAIPTIAQESSTHVIPPGCSSTTVPATPTQPGSVTIQCPALTITTPISLPQATQNKAYSVNMAALVNPKGGAPPYTYTLLTGPTWMKLSINGIVSGTPPATGNLNFTFKVTDSFSKLTEIFEGRFDVAKMDKPSRIVAGR